MRHRPEVDASSLDMPDPLRVALDSYRDRRGFDAADYLARKAERVNEFFAQNSLDTAVVGLSGGIDSTVVAYLLTRCSAVKTVHAMILPALGTDGATGQLDAQSDAERVADLLELPRTVVDITDLLGPMQRGLAETTTPLASAWTKAQSIPYLRTALMHTAVNALADQGHRPVLVGTTNLDEGGFLGFYGKFSEGAVDVQLISDLHKSEVLALATVLGVPADLRERTPRGDMHDATTDTAMFGAPYDAVELMCAVLNEDPEERALWDCDDAAWIAWRDNLLDLRRANAHKYTVPSPAVHLDILPATVKGGANNRPWQPAPPYVGVTDNPLPPLWTGGQVVSSEHTVGVDMRFQLLTPSETKEWLDWFGDQDTVRTASSGRVKDYRPGDRPHSERASVLDPETADILWSRVAPHLAQLQIDTDDRSTLYRASAGVWEPCGVSSYLRFIRYTEGGFLAPHYDEEFVVSEDEQTLLSLVLHLSDAQGTRFLRDPQAGTAVVKRDRSDWTRSATPEEVVSFSPMTAGYAAVFPHHLLHDGGDVHTDASRVVVRTDVLFRRVRS